jgi:GNAT superfamily N-acetyltransferase
MTDHPSLPKAFELRPLRARDAPVAFEVSRSAFDDLDRRLGAQPEAASDQRRARGEARVAHLATTDPEGCWGAWNGSDQLMGVALAIRRESLWGLSLLVVDPACQSLGIGRALLDAALSTAADADGGMIESSPDRRAMRRYASAGFDLLPAARAVGVPRWRELPAGVRPGCESDLPRCDEISRQVRGAAHGSDLLWMQEHHARWLFLEDASGYAFHLDGNPILLAALSDEGATTLLNACLAEAPPDTEVSVEHITHAQQWAVRAAVDAGLMLEPWGAMFVRGRLGAMTPYLSSGAFL